MNGAEQEQAKPVYKTISIPCPDECENGQVSQYDGEYYLPCGRCNGDGVISVIEGIEESEIEAAIHQYAAKQIAKALDNGVGVIYGIANDLANRDPKALGSVPLDPYFANAVAIYSEFLKGDKYERIDWKALKLPTLERIKQFKEVM